MQQWPSLFSNRDFYLSILDSFSIKIKLDQVFIFGCYYEINVDFFAREVAFTIQLTFMDVISPYLTAFVYINILCF